jgi:hypothetical protein
VGKGGILNFLETRSKQTKRRRNLSRKRRVSEQCNSRVCN